MIQSNIHGITIFQFEQLKKIKDLFHFVSTRKGGFSSGNFSSLNLSYKVNDSKKNVDKNRKKLIDGLNISDSKILIPDQCHTSNVYVVTENTMQEDLQETDAVITITKHLCIAVLAADCVPVLLYDPENEAIGAVHSGWRGTAQRIVVRTIERMVKVYRTNPQNLLACIGPAISQQYYEVSKEVADHFSFWFTESPTVLIKNNRTGEYHIDLREANRQLLLRMGVLNSNIEVGGICTYDNPDRYFSARRDGIRCGRFASGIMLT